MIAMGPNFPATHGAAVNDNAVRQGLHLYTKSTQTIGHHLNAVTLLDPQLLGTAQNGTAFGTGGSNKQHRKLVNCQGYQLGRYLDSLQLRAPDTNICHTLATDYAHPFKDRKSTRLNSSHVR